jgi:VWFA-related protein
MLRPAFLFAAVLICSLRFDQQDASQPPPRSQSSGKLAPAVPENHTVLPPQESAKITARTDLVLVPVIVKDKSGKNVSGLPKEAFRVEENGKSCGISVFEETKTEKLVTRRGDITNEGYSNFFPDGGHAWRVTAFVLDMINTPWMRQLEAKRQLIDYLLRSASRDEAMAIFGLNSSGLHQLHPFTTRNQSVDRRSAKTQAVVEFRGTNPGPGAVYRRPL